MCGDKLSLNNIIKKKKILTATNLISERVISIERDLIKQTTQFQTPEMFAIALAEGGGDVMGLALCQLQVRAYAGKGLHHLGHRRLRLLA